MKITYGKRLFRTVLHGARILVQQLYDDKRLLVQKLSLTTVTHDLSPSVSSFQLSHVLCPQTVRFLCFRIVVADTVLSINTHKKVY